MGGSWATRSVKRWQASGGDEIEMTRVRSKGLQWRDLGDAVWGWGSAIWAVVWWLGFSSCSLSFYSLFGCLSPEKHLKVNEMCKWFFGSMDLFYCQSLRFSVWLYFTCAPKHAYGYKVFSQFHLHLKQTQPQFQIEVSLIKSIALQYKWATKCTIFFFFFGQPFEKSVLLIIRPFY